MSQRNPMNDRYNKDNLGKTRKSSASAKPKAARAALLDTIPMKRLGAAEDVARAVAFFAGEGAGYVTGQVLCVDGGMAV